MLADFGNGKPPVTLSVVKVSRHKFGVHTRRGFSARRLTGAEVVRRTRRDGAGVAEVAR